MKRNQGEEVEMVVNSDMEQNVVVKRDGFLPQQEQSLGGISSLSAGNGESDADISFVSSN